MATTGAQERGAVRIVRVALVALAYAVGGCDFGDDASTPDTPPAKECDQTCRDQNTGRALTLLIEGLYNQNVAGKTTGVQKATGPCPLSGSTDITGSTGAGTSNGITTVNLNFALTKCRVSASGADLVFNGTVAYVGSFDGQNFLSTNYSSEALDLEGTVTSLPESGRACAVRVNRSSTTAPLTGIICGRTF